MRKRPRKTKNSQAELKDFVTVAFAEDWEQAKDYESLLRNNDIPATITEQHDRSVAGKSIAVMVPEDFLDEAHVVIESQGAYDDFYDFALEDDDEDDFNGDLFEDDL